VGRDVRLSFTPTTLATIGLVLRSNAMAESQTNHAWDIVLDLGRPGDGPLHERLTAALRDAIRARRIADGDRLPPSRSLAADLGCSRWTVTEAFAQLAAEGYLTTRTGSGTRVRWSTDDAPAHSQAVAADRDPRPPRFDLSPGLPDLRAFPRRGWANALSAQIGTVAFTELGYPPGQGHVRLRELLAAYLRRSRHAVTTPDDLTINTSVTAGVQQLCRAMAAEGITAIGCEEPGWTRLRTVIRAAGLDTVAIPTDGDGLRVTALHSHPGLRAVLVTPAHQFPQGTVLSPQRRADLVRWAHDTDGVVLEDDYDAEFRYDRRPVGALQGMEPGRVVLLKSVSKTLSPALGIGWIASPPRWTAALRAVGQPSATPPVLDQLAFAALLESGDYDRHLRRVRHRYRQRRDVLIAELGRAVPRLQVCGIAAGLHLVLRLPDTIDSADVLRSAAAASLRLADVRSYHDDVARSTNGLVLGYGNLADTAVVDAVQALQGSLRAAGPRR
jgi:GntR family transcriptional regulator/MocR family aminotransferase